MLSYYNDNFANALLDVYSEVSFDKLRFTKTSCMPPFLFDLFFLVANVDSRENLGGYGKFALAFGAICEGAKIRPSYSTQLVQRELQVAALGMHNL